jgi:hypothetical protein
MGQYDTGDLYRRQHQGDVGNAVLGSVDAAGSRRRWRALRVPVGVMGVGMVLSLWGPLPGLGVFLVAGGVMGLALTAGMVLLNGFS